MDCNGGGRVFQLDLGGRNGDVWGRKFGNHCSTVNRVKNKKSLFYLN